MRIKFAPDAINGDILTSVMEVMEEFLDQHKLTIANATLYVNAKTVSLKPAKVAVKEANGEVEWLVQKKEFTKADDEGCTLIATLKDDDDDTVGYLYKKIIDKK